jgi:uncharacterized protein YceK
MSNKKIMNLANILLFLTIMLTSGCASMTHKSELSSFNSLYSSTRVNYLHSIAFILPGSILKLRI